MNKEMYILSLGASVALAFFVVIAATFFKSFRWISIFLILIFFMSFVFYFCFNTIGEYGFYY